MGFKQRKVDRPISLLKNTAIFSSFVLLLLDDNSRTSSSKAEGFWPYLFYLKPNLVFFGFGLE